MNTLPHHAQKGNTFLYALTEDIEQFTWQAVRYIGITVDPEYRYYQHLGLHDRSNEDKNEWIADCLAHGKTPRMFRLEEIPASVNAREREQFAIRYAMEQGADLFNRAITYTDEERTRIHQRRAARYTKIAEILAKGIYVKRWTGNFYPSRLLGKYTPPPSNPTVSLVNSRCLYFVVQDDMFRSIYEATDAEFDAFICQHIPIYPDNSDEWTLEERRDAIEFARYFVGGTLGLFLQEGA